MLLSVSHVMEIIFPQRPYARLELVQGMEGGDGRPCGMDIAPEDLRALPAPEPLLRVLERIAESEGPLAFLLPFVPTPIFPLLGTYGWSVDTRATDEGFVITLVRNR
jgi:hypothetical protein